MKKIFLLILILILSACSLGTPSEFERNHQTWLDSGVTHYRFSLNIGCFCAFSSQMPLTIEVLNAEIISMTYADGTRILKTDPNYETFAQHATIERLFSELEAGLSGDSDEVAVTYDSARGFPTEIYFDYIKIAADEEITLSVSNFQVLK